VPAPSGAPDVVYRLDVHAERADARLRLVGAVVCGLGALVIASLRPTLIGWVVVVVAAVAALGWTASWVATRRRTAEPRRYALTLTHEALTLHDAGRDTALRWHAIRAVDVDEDRLVVRVYRTSGDAPLVIEPRYEGVSVYALAEQIAARVPGAASQNERTP
jgi:hypothetical protein